MPALERRRLLGSMAAFAVAAPLAPTSTARAENRTTRQKLLTTTLTLRPQNGFIPPLGPNVTLSTLYNLEAAPLWVRLIYLASVMAYTIDGAAIAPTSAVHDGFTPVNQAGQPEDALWQRVTFSHDGDDSAPAPQSKSQVHSLKVPYRKAPVLGYSDWLPVDALPRTDGGYGALLLVRTFSSGVFRATVSPQPDLLAKEIHRDFILFRSEGDGTAPPWQFNAKPDLQTASFGLQYVTSRPGATVVGIGDSIMMPWSSVPYGLRACALASTPAQPVSYVNDGYSGQRSSYYLAIGATTLAALKPQVALIQTFSANDPFTPDSADQSFNGAMQLALMARRQNCVPILVTDGPEAQLTDAEEAVRQTSLRRTREAASNGFLVLDLDALWGTEGMRDTWKHGYGVDRWHPSDAATTVAGQALAAMLRQILDRT